jgi:hypothetical protein
MNATARNTALSLVGLGALTIYILACTSFSPDDKKVLFPTFDPSGRLGMAVYDRETGRSELLYVPMVISGNTNQEEGLILRGAWLPDGKNVLIVAAGEARKEELGLTMIPVSGQGAVRTFTIADLEKATMSLAVQPCLSGYDYILRPDARHLARLNLRTGALQAAELPEEQGELTLYPAPDGRDAFYVESGKNDAAIFGRVDPARLTLTPLVTITNRVMDGSFFAYDASGSRVAFVEEKNNAYECVLLDNGKTRFSRKIGATSRKLAFGGGVLSPKADRVWATFARTGESDHTELGLIEIPLSEVALKEKVIVPQIKDDRESVMYCQIAVAHDGKTAAIATTYLACADEDFRQEDCALFLVNLADPSWKLTKVPIAMPAKRVNVIK